MWGDEIQVEPMRLLGQECLSARLPPLHIVEMDVTAQPGTS